MPIWIYVELMTFSDISQLFNLLKPSIKNVIDYRLYSYYLTLKQMLLPKDVILLSSSIKDLFKKYPLIDIKQYGFPNNWI